MPLTSCRTVPMCQNTAISAQRLLVFSLSRMPRSVIVCKHDWINITRSWWRSMTETTVLQARHVAVAVIHTVSRAATEAEDRC